MTRPLSSTVRAANAALYSKAGLDVVDEFFTEDYVAHVTDEDLPLGRNGVRKILGLYRRAFPDVQVEVEILVESEDRVAWLRTLRGTHVGTFKGFPPSEGLLVWRDMVTSRFHSGKIAEEWIVTDLAERLLSARKR